MAGGACTGAGVGPTQLHHVLGIVKAYTTRVGGGPFPTECLDAIGDHLVECGVEFGSTTGRRRRCGWLDTVVLRDSARLNGLTGLAITKLDVLTTLNPVKICVAYDVDGVRRDSMPATIKELERCRPVFEELPGWQEDIRGVRRFEDFPAATRNYLKRLEELVGVPIQIVSVGPGPGRDHRGAEPLWLIGRPDREAPPRAAVLHKACYSHGLNYCFVNSGFQSDQIFQQILETGKMIGQPLSALGESTCLWLTNLRSLRQTFHTEYRRHQHTFVRRQNYIRQPLLNSQKEGISESP